MLRLGDHDFGAPLDQLGFVLPSDFVDYFQEASIELTESEGEIVVRLEVVQVRATYEGFRLWVY